MTTTSTNTPLPLVPGRWTLDANHSSVGFAIRHLGISKVRGVFHQVDLDMRVGATLDDTSVVATIDVGSIDTGNPDRDAHVLSDELLDAAARPQLRFASTSIAETGDGWAVTGDLTFGDVTTPVALDVEFGGVESYPMDGTTHAGFEATGTVDRHDLGVHLGALDAALGRNMQLAFDIQLVAPNET